MCTLYISIVPYSYISLILNFVVVGISTIKRSEFINALGALKVKLSKSELIQIFDYLDSEDKGKIRIRAAVFSIMGSSTVEKDGARGDRVPRGKRLASELFKKRPELLDGWLKEFGRLQRADKHVSLNSLLLEFKSADRDKR